MAVSKAMLRLLRIRELEEEQSRVALESALGELSQLEQALTRATDRGRLGRQLVAQSVWTGELPDRLAGIEESHVARRFSSILSSRIESAMVEVAALREQLLHRRVERRQAETLVEESRAQQAVEALRREQLSLDDWFRNRKTGKSGRSDYPVVKLDEELEDSSES